MTTDKKASTTVNLEELSDLFDQALELSDNRTLGEVLQDKRKEIGVTVKDISKITSLSESIIGKIEADKVNDMSASTMLKMCLAYGINPDNFLSYLYGDILEGNISKEVREVSEARVKIKMQKF